jgi:hypothetical protein
MTVRILEIGLPQEQRTDSAAPPELSHPQIRETTNKETQTFLKRMFLKHRHTVVMEIASLDDMSPSLPFSPSSLPCLEGIIGAKTYN